MFFDIKVLGSQEITIIKAFDMIEFYFKRRENMAYRCGERYQMGLLPQSIEEYVADNDPVRAYDAFVDALTFHDLGIEIDRHKVGNAEYDPKSMVKLLVYGYSYGVKSSRWNGNVTIT